VCPSCGIEGILDVLYDYQKIGQSWRKADLSADRENSLWRYFPLLPVGQRQSAPPLRAGWTPLYSLPQMARQLGLGSLHIKDDGINPTASFKDRASCVAVARAREQGASRIACASTGNAASSLAGMAASVGLPCDIFVPRRAPAAKVAQLLIFGARVFSVDGAYDDAFDLSLELIDALGAYNRNCAINPYLVEGKKTAAFEICEQMNWQVPDYVVTSVGDGCIISGLWKGFNDFYRLGFIERLPVLVAVQAEHCQPVVQALASGTFVQSGTDTIADSIAVGIPRNRLKALRALRESHGLAAAVPDAAILDAMRSLGRNGIFAEPAGATGFAGFLKLASDGAFASGARVVVLVTGSGLKDSRTAGIAAGSPIDVPKSAEAVLRIIRGS